MFSMLASMDVLEGSRVLDLFAGSGALGIESVSRGAATAVLVDHDPRAVEAARSNLEVLGPWTERATVVLSDVTKYLSRASNVDLVLADPPYEFDEWPALFVLLEDRTPLVVTETASPIEVGPRWETVKQKRYGGTVVGIVQRVISPVDGRRLETTQEGEN
jgi:16S rRNA (guanine966-N2)-methyltransferase